MFQQQELNVGHLKNVFFQSLEWGLSGIDIPEARNARWIRKRFKKEKVWWAGEEVDLLSDGFHSWRGFRLSKQSYYHSQMWFRILALRRSPWNTMGVSYLLGTRYQPRCTTGYPLSPTSGRYGRFQDRRRD